MVLKCKVPITAALIMNKHGSSSSLSINMEPGVHEPFKVILQLYMYIHFFFFFLGGEPRAFIRSSRRFMTQGSFRATKSILDLDILRPILRPIDQSILRPNTCLLRGNGQ